MTILTDTIGEYTSAAGVTVDGVGLKDGTVVTDTIVEQTSANGVDVDGVLLKDSSVTATSSSADVADSVASAGLRRLQRRRRYHAVIRRA